MQADAKSVYDILFRPPPEDPLDGGGDADRAECTDVGCLSHARRRYWEATIARSEVAREGLARLGRVFALERTWKKHPPAICGEIPDPAPDFEVPGSVDCTPSVIMPKATWSKIGGMSTGYGWAKRASMRPFFSLVVGLWLAVAGDGMARGQAEDAIWSNLMDQAQASRRSRQSEQALRFARAAEARARSLARGPDERVALSLVAVGEIEAGGLDRKADALRDLDEALRIERAVYGGSSAAGAVPIATILNAISNVYFGQSQFGRAADYLQQATAIASAAGSQELFAGCLGNMAWLQINLLDYPKALAAVQQAIAIYQRINQPKSLAHQFRTLGFVRQATGATAEAEAAFRQAVALDLRHLGPENLAVADDHCALAGALLSLRRGAEAFKEYDLCLSIRQRLLKPTDRLYGIVAETLEGIASAYGSTGDIDAALSLYQRALSIRTQVFGADSLEAGLAGVRVAGAYLARGDGQTALHLLLPAVDLLKRHGASTRSKEEAQQLMAKILMQTNLLETKLDAKILYQQLAEQERKAGQLAALGETLQLLGAVCLKVDDHSCALDAFSRALANQRRVYPDPSLEVALAHSALGDAWYWLHDYDRAAQEFGAAFEQWRRLAGTSADSPFGNIDTNTYVDSLWRILPAAAAPGSIQRLAELSFQISQLSYHSAAARALSQLAARVASGNGELAATMRSEQDLASARQALQKSYASVLATSDDQDQARKLDGLRTQIADLDRRQQDAQRVLATRLPAYRALTESSVLDVKTVQALLAEDEMLLTFNFGPQGGFVWGVTTDGVSWSKIDLTEAQLAAEVKALRSGLDEDGASPDQRGLVAAPTHAGLPFDRVRAHALYRALLGPVGPALAKAKSLLFVPIGPIDSLPPAVLVTEPPATPHTSYAGLRATAWLVRDKAITIIPSLSALTALNRIEEREGRAPNPFLGIGAPDLAGFSRMATCAAPIARRAAVLGTLPPLPGAAEELEQIATSLHGGPGDVFTGPRATEELLGTLNLASYRVLAFSTHGLVAGEASLSEPALVVTPPPRCAPDAGLLTASKVSQLSLAADWVVLSACNTASGDGSSHAQGLSGLARAFFFAGARNILVSHWSVNNRAAVALTTRTFAALAADPRLGKAEALRRAMLSLIDDTSNPEASHPSYWAPFVLVGGGARRPLTAGRQ